jgi:hypothetical protein
MNHDFTERLAGVKTHLTNLRKQHEATRALEEVAVKEVTEIGEWYSSCVRAFTNKQDDETPATVVQARECYNAAVAKFKQLADAVNIYSKEIAYYKRTEIILTLLLENAAEKDRLEMSLQNATTTAQLAHDQHTAILLQMEINDHNSGDLTKALEVAHAAATAANDALGQLIQESAVVSEAYKTIMAEWDDLRVD